MTPRESFCPGMERLHGSPSVLECKTPGESFCPGMERLMGSPSVIGKNDSRGVILSCDGRTPGESFCPGME